MAESDDLIAYFVRTINELAGPVAEQYQKSSEMKQAAAAVLGGDPKFDGTQLIVLTLIPAAVYIAWRDGRSSTAAELFLRKLLMSLGFTQFVNQFPAGIIQTHLDSFQDFKSRPKGTPFLVELLTEYDQNHATAHAEQARSFLWRFANAVAKCDNTVTRNEQAFLREYRKELYPQRVDSSRRSSASKASRAKPGHPATDKALDDLLAELDSLVGLDSVKSDVLQLVNFLRVQQLRESRGLPGVPVSRHLVFCGNPGTGKTTVARLLSQIYRCLNIITQGHLVETDRSGLVAGYVGQTALKVKEVVTKALGGTLFIDEAYALGGDQQDYGREAGETLLKLMEDHRDDLIVIVAGYPERMEAFLRSNPGLRSRFSKFFQFADYTPEQLCEIFALFCGQAGFHLTQEAEVKLLGIFQGFYDIRDESFGNARLARNLFEQTISNQANRIICLAHVDDMALSTIHPGDIPNAHKPN